MTRASAVMQRQADHHLQHHGDLAALSLVAVMSPKPTVDRMVIVK